MRLTPGVSRRHFDLDIAEACHAYGLAHLPYGTLAGGYLSGKYRNGAAPEGARHTALPDFQPRYATPAVAAAVERYAAVAQRQGISLTQLAVAWCVLGVLQIRLKLMQRSRGDERF